MNSVVHVVVGKLYQIYFDEDTRLVTGASITTYLLEKSRVCERRVWEASHITILPPQLCQVQFSDHFTATLGSQLTAALKWCEKTYRHTFSDLHSLHKPIDEMHAKVIPNHTNSTSMMTSGVSEMTE